MNNIYICILKRPLYFQLDAFKGFRATFVYKLEGIDKILGINNEYLPESNKLPGIDYLVKVLFGKENGTVTRGIPEDFLKNVISTVSFEVTDETFNLIKEEFHD